MSASSPWWSYGKKTFGEIVFRQMTKLLKIFLLLFFLLWISLLNFVDWIFKPWEFPLVAPSIGGSILSNDLITISCNLWFAYSLPLITAHNSHKFSWFIQVSPIYNCIPSCMLGLTARKSSISILCKIYTMKTFPIHSYFSLWMSMVIAVVRAGSGAFAYMIYLVITLFLVRNSS